MTVIILAGGYATRMGNLVEDLPKPLLPIAPNKSCLSTILGEFKGAGPRYVASNEAFYLKYHFYLEGRRGMDNVVLISDGSLKKEKKRGAVGTLLRAVERLGLVRDIFVVAGDNLWGFDTKSFIEHCRAAPFSVIALKKFEDKSKIAKKLGCAHIGEGGFITEFEEKPENPKSDLASTAIYHFKQDALSYLSDYVATGGKDNIGGFLSYLLDKGVKLKGFIFDEHWFDIGTPENYKEAKEYYKKKK